MMRVPPAEPTKRFPRSRGPWVALVVLAGLALADRSGLLLADETDDLKTYHGRIVSVAVVVSGSEFEIDVRDAFNRRATTQVRLWGVAAPQPPRPGREGEPRWQESLAYVESLVREREVVLKLESHRTRDGQGRLLAHIEHPDGGTLNEMILEAGLARRDEQWPHAMLTAYAQAENRAQRRASGVWAR